MLEEGIFKFNRNYLDKSYQPEVIGRIQFPDGSTIRLMFTDVGLVAFINTSKDSKHVLIQKNAFEDGISFAGLGPK
jgi:hypothetical protein